MILRPEFILKIALVHDYFTQMGGAERVAEELYDILPSADLFATVALTDKLPHRLRGVQVTTSWMQRLPYLRTLYRMYFPLYPAAIGSLNLDAYRLVVTSSSGYAKGVKVHPDAIHVCYCHTPMRWAWNTEAYLSREAFGGGIKLALPLLLYALRMWDEGAARQPDHFVANSNSVAARIKRVYGRHAEVIEPPIEVARFHLSDTQDNYYLILSRLISYKRIDIAIKAFTAMGKMLIVVGDGPAKASLMALAGPTITFLGRIEDEQVCHLASRCKALIFPGEEDFGMAPLEVAAAGRPTIAFRAGGAIETIIENETGCFFDQPHPESLIEAVLGFERRRWTQNTLRLHAEKYSPAIFRQRFLDFLSRVGATI